MNFAAVKREELYGQWQVSQCLFRFQRQLPLADCKYGYFLNISRCFTLKFSAAKRLSCI
nr:MAG TPA: hypothetical protein [Caudoviricetes sp.]